MSDLQDFLNNSISIFKSDERFFGIAVAGSWITGTTDKFSDLDLIVACDDDSYDSILKERKSIASSLGQLVASFTGEHVGEPRLLICLYDNPVLHVDLKFIRINDLLKRIENPVVVWERNGKLSEEMSKQPANHPMPDLQWVEDRFWVWVHYGATKLGRGELFEVIDFLSFLRGQILGSLSLVKHGQLPRGARRLESLALDDVADFKKTVPSYDLVSCIKAFEMTISLYRKLREEMDKGDLKRGTQAETVAMNYLEQVILGFGIKK